MIDVKLFQCYFQGYRYVIVSLICINIKPYIRIWLIDIFRLWNFPSKLGYLYIFHCDHVNNGTMTTVEDVNDIWLLSTYGGDDDQQ